MNSYFEFNGTAIFEGVVAGAVLLVLNAIGHYGFEAPAIPFVHGLAILLAVIVAARRSFRRPDDDPHYGS
ncbi:MAG: hypothetical protein E4H19_07415 [Chromatiales bacterium]|jgi:hypothetical protein|nr:MAG: hypothetical protein E4H19_07415 [Chromatiales bacterium]